MSPACGGAAANASPAATGSPRRRQAPPRIRRLHGLQEGFLRKIGLIMHGTRCCLGCAASDAARFPCDASQPTAFFAKFWPKANPEPGYWQYVLALSNVTAVSPVAVIVRWSVSLNARLELPPCLQI